jgi:hypothetical protein
MPGAFCIFGDMPRLLVVLLSGFILVLGGCSNSSSYDPCTPMKPLVIPNEQFNNAEIDINFSADEFLNCFDYGDYVAITPEGHPTIYAPVVSDYYQVMSGENLLWAYPGFPYIVLAKNMYGVHVDFRRKDEATQRWRFLEGEVNFPLKVSIELYSKAPPPVPVDSSQILTRKDSIRYYPDLTVEEFANFRMISVSGIRDSLLYRASSPIDPSIGRNLYVDSLARKLGIQAFINMTDDRKEARMYEDFTDTYYSTRNVVYASLPTNYTMPEFKSHLLNILRYLYTNDGPFLLHCKEGKDRTGFVSAVLEALMGASLEEILADYLKTFTNYYNVEGSKHVPPRKEQLERVRENFVAYWISVYAEVGVDISDIENVDLAEATANYFVNIGFDEYEIGLLKTRLAP